MKKLKLTMKELKMIVRVIKTKERAKLIFNSTKDVWYETLENQQEQVYLLTFGASGGSVLYVYETSKPFEIDEIVEGDLR